MIQITARYWTVSQKLKSQEIKKEVKGSIKADPESVVPPKIDIDKKDVEEGMCEVN